MVTVIWHMLLVALPVSSKVYIDEDNITIVDGKPFFPLGLFVGNGPATDSAIRELEEIADSPFNTIMNYSINEGNIDQIRRYLSAADRHGLKIIYSMKDFYEGTKYYPGRVGDYKGEDEMVRGIITEFKHHPAILAWYINDELPSKYIPRLIKRYKTIKALDSDHPTWAVLCQIDEIKSYIGTADIIGVDPYPIPDRPISMVAEWAQLLGKAVGKKGAVWMVPQIHDASIYSPGTRSTPSEAKRRSSPTFEEMRCMAYQCIVNGANGLIFYSFFDLKRDPLGYENRWSEVKRLGAEIHSLIPILLSTEDVPKVQLSSGGRYIHFLTRRFNGKLYIIAVNISDKQKDAEFIISDEVKDVEVLFEDRIVPVEKYHLRDRFSPMAVHVYKGS